MWLLMPLRWARVLALLLSNQRSRSVTKSCACVLAVSTSISPCGLIRTADIGSPACLTALIARNTSVRRKASKLLDIVSPIKNPREAGHPELTVNRGNSRLGVSAPLPFAKANYVGRAGWREATMTTLEFLAVLYVALCVGATVAYVIATLLINASKR